MSWALPERRRRSGLTMMKGHAGAYGLKNIAALECELFLFAGCIIGQQHHGKHTAPHTVATSLLPAEYVRQSAPCDVHSAHAKKHTDPSHPQAV